MWLFGVWLFWVKTEKSRNTLYDKNKEILEIDLIFRFRGSYNWGNNIILHRSTRHLLEVSLWMRQSYGLRKFHSMKSEKNVILFPRKTKIFTLKIALSEKLSKHEGEWNMQNHHKWGNPVFVPKNQCGSKLATPQQLTVLQNWLLKISIVSKLEYEKSKIRQPARVK